MYSTSNPMSEVQFIQYNKRDLRSKSLRVKAKCAKFMDRVNLEVTKQISRPRFPEDDLGGT